jgi:5'-nucleotidase
LTSALPSRPQVVITNDDGAASQGLHALATAVESWAQVTVVAPLDQESRMSRAMPIRSGRIFELSMQVGEKPRTVYAVDGSPVLAVQHALIEICNKPPDLILSGINYGENVGVTATTSGTIGAVLEAASWGIPSIAFSKEMPGKYMIDNPDYDFTLPAELSSNFARLMYQRDPMVGCYKVDFPETLERNTPWAVTFVSKVRKYDLVAPRRQHLWERSPIQIDHAAWKKKVDKFEIGSDAYVLLVDQTISVAPLTVDATDRERLAVTAEIIRTNSDVL